MPAATRTCYRQGQLFSCYLPRRYESGYVKPLLQKGILELMTKYHIRHLPVEDGGRLVGMVSMRDVMQMIISIREDRIERLESYILGSDYSL